MTASAPLPTQLNVLMVNTVQSGGGAGRVGAALAGALRAGGDQVRAIVAAKAGADPSCARAGHWREQALVDWLTRRGLTDLGRLSSLLWSYRADFAAADVVHWHNLHGNYLSIAALPLWGWQKPIVWTLHDFWALTGNCATPCTCRRWQHGCGRCPLTGVYPVGGEDRTHLYRWVKPRLIAAARPLLVTPSEWLAARVRSLRELRRLPLRVIRNPVACDVFKPSDDRAGLRRRFGLAVDAPTVVLAGHNWLDRLKGGHDAAVALRRAAEQVPGLQVLVLGAASESVRRASGRPGRAWPFIRARGELAQALACADVCLFPSRAENYPLVPLEAMACGTPVVAYAVGGVGEQIEHLQTGLLAPDGQAEELAAGIVHVLRTPQAARAMGQAARAFVVKTCHVDVIAARYRRVYGEALRAWLGRRGRQTARGSRGWLSRHIAGRLGWEGQGPGERDDSDSTRTPSSPLVASQSRA
jgi:glycosyltransferase involved in cell wall biosynthesis